MTNTEPNNNSNKMTNVIYWEKYKDCFEKLISEIDEEFDDDEMSSVKLIRGKNYPMFNTNNGPMPINDYNIPSKTYNLWVGHTNFEITPNIFNLIANTPGVEFIRPWTRYRFVIGFARGFCNIEYDEDGNMTFEDASSIRLAIREKLDQKLGGNVLDNPLQGVKMMAEGLRLISKNWAICVLPNMAIDVAIAQSDEDQDYQNKLKMYELARTNVNAEIITNHNYEL